MRFKKIAMAITFSLAVAGWTQNAFAIVYNVNSTIGAGGVTGSITTDGTIGVIGTANVTDWNLVLDDGVGTFNLLGPISGSNSARLISGSSFTANATDLLFDFSGSGFVLFQNPTTGTGINFWCIEVSGCINASVGQTVRLINASDQQTVSRTGIVTIATTATSVSEPGTLAILGLGLASLVAIRRRKTA